MSSSPLMRPSVLLGIGATLLALLLVACGGGESDAPSATPSPAASPGSSADVGSGGRYCAFRTNVPPEYELKLKARWSDKRITIDGSVKLPGPANVSWFICQDGQPSPNFAFLGEPKIRDGKIRGASVVAENPLSPVPFNPDATFEVVVFAQDVDFGLPYFATRVPVEGKPD